MANTVKLKRSAVPLRVPTTTDLDLGEIAINTFDGKAYIKQDVLGVETIVQLGGGGGSGDVTGAASSTDNAITRFDGTTGKIIQNSTVTLDDTGNIVNTNSVQFDITPIVPTATGAMYWDDGNKTPSINLDADVTLQLGQENVALVYNGTGSTITNGSVVAVSGAQGQRPSVSLADADSEALSAPTLGIATEDIANGAEGFIVTFGFVRGINTSAFTAGAPIYLSQTAGQFTATRPSAPAHTVALGWVIKVNASSGEVFVNINNGWELDELHNVLITSAASGNTLIYDAVAGVWENANLTDGTGITITEGAGTITVANSGVLSVTGTAPVVSSGGQNPVISMPAATTSVSGYLTSTDWNTFNSKTSNTGTVTSVSATVPTGLSIAGSPITTSGTLAITYTAGYAIPTTASQTNWDTAYSVRQQWNGGSTNLVAATGRTSLGATTVGGNFFTLTNPTAITFPRMNADNTVSALDAATFRTAIGAGTGSGTVTGVTATSPVASSGGTAPVISLSAGYGDTLNPYASKTANFVLAAPTGVAGVPTFRAIVAADIPTLNQNTTGSSGSCTGNAATATNADTVDTYHASLVESINTLATRNASGYLFASYFNGSGTFATTGITSGMARFTGTNGTDTYGRSYTAAAAAAALSGQTMNIAGSSTSCTGNAATATTATTATTANGVAAGVVAGKMIYNSFTATAAQTTFTTTNTYTASKIEVYANGIKMVNGSDVTVTSGTSVVFATGVAVNTRVDLVYPI